MNIEKKLSKMYGDINDLGVSNSYNGHVLLDISEPLMFVLNELNNYYLAYTLQNRTLLLNNDTKADIVEVLIVNTSFPMIKKLLEGELDIKKALSSDCMYRIGKIGDKVFPKKYVSHINEVEDRVPEYGVRLDGAVPNKINLMKVLHMIESSAKVYEPFSINEKKVYTDNTRIEPSKKEKQSYNYLNESDLKEYYLKKIYGDRIEEKNEVHY